MRNFLKSTIFAACILARGCVPMPAQASPPPYGSPDWEILHSFAEWVETQHTGDGQYCCSLSDARPLDTDEIRVTNGHYEIFFSKAHWGAEEGTDTWVPVMDSAILHIRNPIGYPIAWAVNQYEAGIRVYCLILTGAV